MAEQTELFAPITFTKKGSTADGAETRFVYGPVSNSSIDIDLQRANPEWLKSALSEWWSWANIQAGHNGPDVGVGVDLTKDADSDTWMLLSEVVDRDAITKVDKGVYKGYSIGIRWPQLSYKSATAPGGEIIGGKIVHVALCGRPAVEAARFAVADSPDAFVFGKSAFADVEAETIEQAEQILKDARSGVTVNPDGSHDPMTGRHTHDHPAFGSQGDDKTHEHDHEHHQDADHNHHADAGAKAASADAKEQAESDQGYDSSDAPFADPKNHRWPVGTAKRARSAMAYYNAGKGKEGHSDSDWAAIGRRIATAANKFFGSGHALEGGKITSPDNKDASAADEVTDAALAKQAADIVTQLIAREASELIGDDDTDDLYDVDTLRVALNCLQSFIQGEAFEAAMLGMKSSRADVHLLVLPELYKSGARNNAADQQRIQAIHDHTGNLGASASDECKANADGDGDMDEKAARALVADELKTALPKAIEDALVAAGVTPDLVKSAMAKDDVAELLKGAVSPLEERLTAVENRAEDGGPLLMAVQRGLAKSQVSSHKAALAEEVASLWQTGQTHQDPRVRAQATLDYAKKRAELDAIKD